MGWAEGFEPSATGTTIRRSTKLSYAHREGPYYRIKAGVAPQFRLQAGALPQFIHPPLHFPGHTAHAGPGAREAFSGPLARGVDAHLRAIVRQPAGMVQGIDRPQDELDVALGVDVVQGFP